MGALAKQLSHIDQVKDIISLALSHFDSMGLDAKRVEQFSVAADLAFSDLLLFEKFEIWNEERDDKALLYHVDRFFEKRSKTPLSVAERDLSSHREQIELSVKDQVRENQKRLFSERITQLAVENGLLTNEQLGAFLNVSTEQARKYKTGEFKPQLGTLKQISEKFKVSIEFLAGLSSQR
jgi:hypothetical protein